MSESRLSLISRIAEFEPKDHIKRVPTGTRGLYVLYRQFQEDEKVRYDVVYVGLARKGMRGRLTKHAKSKRKGAHWTHFSAYEVQENVGDDMIVELEGLFRHIYRQDSRANALNVQRSFKKVAKVRQKLDNWKDRE